jgi:hypothetical protein
VPASETQPIEINARRAGSSIEISRPSVSTAESDAEARAVNPLTLTKEHDRH